MDPLIRLPVEVNVGILTLCSPSDILRLEAVSQTWKAFIKEHEAHIWAAAAIAHEFKTADVMQERLGHSALGQADLKTFLSSKWSFQRDTWSSVHTWREYSRRKTLLHRNLNSTRPVMARRHMMCRVPHVWRMRPDFEAGLLICTSERGGLQVYDLESSERLWSLSADQILPYAHLEHSQGTLALNPGIDDTIEIWRRADLVPDRPAQYVRGQYIKVASLPHDAPLRGWHLLFPTLCVVSDEGKAWIHDVAADPPILQRTLEIPRGARGHLEQDDSIVMYAMKRMGYHIYDKSSGKHLGNLDPSVWNLSHSNFFKVKPRQCSERGTSICFCTTQLDFTSIASATKPGPLWSEDQAAEDYDASFGHRDLSQIEWGAGMIHGKIMVGVSQSPWVMIVSDWPAVMRDPSKASDYVSFLLHEECQTSQYHRGGWLAIGGTKDQPRACIESLQWILMLPLPPPGELLRCDEAQLPVVCLPSGGPSHLKGASSFMQLGEDSFITTWTYIGDEIAFKVPQVISFAPWVVEKTAEWEEVGLRGGMSRLLADVHYSDPLDDLL